MVDRLRTGLRTGALLSGCVAALISCNSENNGPTVNAVSPVITRHVVGIAVLTFDNATGQAISSRLVLDSSDADAERALAAGDSVSDVATVNVVPIATGELTVTPLDSLPVRFIRATFGVSNAASAVFDPSRDNLSFVPVATTATFANTPVRVFTRADGTPANQALVGQVAATNLLELNGDGAVEAASPTTLLALSDSIGAATQQPSGVTELFPFAFIVRAVGEFGAGAAALPPVDGLVTFAFRLPVQPVATDNPSTISLVFLLVNDANAVRAP